MAINEKALSSYSIYQEACRLGGNAWEIDAVSIEKHKGAVIVDITGEMTFVYDQMNPQETLRTVFDDGKLSSEVMGATRALLNIAVELPNSDPLKRELLKVRGGRLRKMLIREGRADIANSVSLTKLPGCEVRRF